MSSYEAEAEALARKVIGWRKAALEERRRRESIEAQQPPVAMRETWRALERLDPVPKQQHEQRMRACTAAANAYLAEALKDCEGPLSMDLAGEIMERWCSLAFAGFKAYPPGAAILSIGFGDQPSTYDCLAAGGFDSLDDWNQAVRSMHLPALSRALLQMVWEAAPVRDGSDHNLELQEDEA